MKKGQFTYRQNSHIELYMKKGEVSPYLLFTPPLSNSTFWR